MINNQNRSQLPAYRSWQAMKQRCLNENCKDYRRYGLRGIKIEPKWVDSFDAFYADMGDRPKGTTLDRIDNNGDYTPSNCRWATSKQQARNKRDTVFIDFDGKSLISKDWEKITGIKRCTIDRRLNAGWSVKDALTIPAEEGNDRARYKRDRNRCSNRWLEFNGQTKILADWGKEYGVHPDNIARRIDRFGWSIEDAITKPQGSTKGEKSRGKYSSLNEWQVVWIKKMLSVGNSQRYLAEIFGVSNQVISCINRGITWKHVEV